MRWGRKTGCRCWKRTMARTQRRRAPTGSLVSYRVVKIECFHEARKQGRKGERERERRERRKGKGAQRGGGTFTSVDVTPTAGAAGCGNIWGRNGRRCRGKLEPRN